MDSPDLCRNLEYERRHDQQQQCHRIHLRRGRNTPDRCDAHRLHLQGWYDNENLTGSPVTAIGGAETGNKEYWAKWEINQYIITFDTNGGSEIAPITQDYGTEITVPADPTRKGYTFKGWDKEIPETMPAENITVKAQWGINQYTITFDTNGGSEIAPITQDYGTAITAPDNPTRKGYTFKAGIRKSPKPCLRRI
ncbi:hypothetical protein DWX71_06325 [Ruminococcus bromii]|nr:hypothetical protein DWX71_06325 [Ruminococcus bromii]